MKKRSDDDRSRRLSPFASIPPDLVEVTRKLADQLTYPVNSKAALAEQLGGVDKIVAVGDRKARAGTWVMFMPAEYFPIVSAENLAEKVSELAARRNPMPRTRAGGGTQLRAATDEFFRDERVAQSIAKTLTRALGQPVDVKQFRAAFDELFEDEGAVHAIVDGMRRISTSVVQAP
jgi:hypothetical protein